MARSLFGKGRSASADALQKVSHLRSAADLENACRLSAFCRCTQYGLKLIQFPQLSVAKEIYLNPFKAHVIFKVESVTSVDSLDTALDALDFLHDGVFFTDVEAIKDCVPSDMEFGRSHSAKGRQFVHRSGTLFVRVLNDLRGRALVVVFDNYIYLNKDDKAKRICQDVFSEVAACMRALIDETWEEESSSRRVLSTGEKPIGAETVNDAQDPQGSPDALMGSTDVGTCISMEAGGI